MELWHRLDAAVAATGDEGRHDRRDERVRASMRAALQPDPVPQHWMPPELLEGYALVAPERAARLRAEWEAMLPESQWGWRYRRRS